MTTASIGTSTDALAELVASPSPDQLALVRESHDLAPIRSRVEWVIPVRFAREDRGVSHPPTFRATIDLEGGQTALLEIEVIDGVTRCMAFAIRGSESGDAMRSGVVHIPVQRWLDHVGAQAAALIARTGRADVVLPPTPANGPTVISMPGSGGRGGG